MKHRIKSIYNLNLLYLIPIFSILVGCASNNDESNTKPITVAEKAVLYQINFDDNSKSGFSGDWELSNNGSDNNIFLRPTEFEVSGTKSTTIFYAETHTQMSFWTYTRFDTVDLYIDDNYYHSYSTTNFSKYIVTVPAGAHTYRWEASNGSGRSDVYIDDISFIYNEPVANLDGPHTFEEGFLPLEFTGGWNISGNTKNNGDFSLRAPYSPAEAVSASGIVLATELIYEEAHTQMSFWTYTRFDTVSLYIDDVFYESYSTTNWENHVITVPPGAHTYRWETTVTEAGTPDVYLDDISFIYNEPVANLDGPYTFEEGFLPLEFTGGWNISGNTKNNGNFSLRAPYSPAEAVSASGIVLATELIYEEVHTQMSFWTYTRFDTVSLYIDDVFYESYSTTNWENHIITVPPGAHTYRWETTITEAGIPDVYLDDISFIYNEPVANLDGPYTFEEGFLPLEFTGGWNISGNTKNNGDFSLRAPYSSEGAILAAEINYNVAHTQMSFWTYTRFDTVSLYIDDVFYDSYSTTNWENHVITVSSDEHTYRWETTTTEAGVPDVYIDDIIFY